MNQRAKSLIKEGLEIAKSADTKNKLKILKKISECYSILKTRESIDERTEVRSAGPKYIKEK